MKEKVVVGERKFIKFAIIPVCISEILIVFYFKNFKVLKSDFYNQNLLFYFTGGFLIYLFLRMVYYILKGK